MSKEEKILIIDDELFSREFFQKILEKTDSEVKTAPNGSEGLIAFKKTSYDLVILDIRLPDADGIEILRQIKEINRLTPVIMVTAYGTVDNAVQAMKLGAFDFLMKPFEESGKVLITIKNAIYQGKLERENLLLKNRLKSDSLFPNIVGKSEGMQSVLELIKKASEVDSNVLIQGESGTGKELIARAIHINSVRRKSVFLAIDCGALPENLLETTLFGYEKGAFTGAFKTTKGYFEDADGGTLFLDEIGDASPPLQIRLLRCLQEREVIRVGGTKPYPVDVRVIMATNKDLQEEVVKKRFRKDLFYRINVIKMDLPPLRERREDIPLLAGFFIEKYCSSMNKGKKVLHSKALQILMNHEWPGNVRELQNVIERIVVLHTGETITDEDILEHITTFRGEEDYDFLDYSYDKAKDLFEKRYLENLLKKFPRDLNKASLHAKVHPATLYRKIKHHEIQK
ncbi:MAG: sigma-54-dependent Fis family transcriptional regulator [Deltaproteobacteria bacterium]|nr:sigma-54-dependent Fis family transcriptional regulator [Deltaproteobacteria bacterium]MBM4323959.1 sigma-54-dependent Fis family transcriptional regulator [Deltaproteobacteria bacterium]